MNKPLSKSEFMRKFINDKYDKRFKERQKDRIADEHIFDNMNRIKRKKREF